MGSKSNCDSRIFPNFYFANFYSKKSAEIPNFWRGPVIKMKTFWRLLIFWSPNFRRDRVWNLDLKNSWDLQWGASSRWWSSLYCPIRNSDEMTIGKLHPTLESSSDWPFFQKNILQYKNFRNFRNCDRYSKNEFCYLRNCVFCAIAIRYFAIIAIIAIHFTALIEIVDIYIVNFVTET